MLTAALLFASLGPFGTWEMPFGQRLASWTLFAVGGFLFFRPVVGAARVIATHTRLVLPVAAGLACACAAMPTTLLVAWTLNGMALPQVSVESLVRLYPQVLLVGALVTGVQFMLARPAPPDRQLDVGPPAAAVARPPDFLDRLPAALGRELLALENEDHYVRAHTAVDSMLILMRLRDAVAELEGVDGTQVHRSWWVARAAVAEVVRRDRTITLRLTTGLEVPVARANAADLRAADWL